MLYTLHVKDLALIKEQEIEFHEGLNILTGETGAGKSIIIGSVNLALGGKADKEMIRTGAEYALVELTFFVDNKEIVQKIKSMDLPIDDEGTVVLSRKIMQGRSICKVGGESVNLKQLRELGELLINIHGQNDHQALLHKKKHLEILDSYSEKELNEYKKELANVWKYHEEIRKKLDDTNLDEATRKREQDLASYELSEISQAELSEGEDEELETKYRKMVNGRKIAEAASMANESIFAEDKENASDSISDAVSRLSSVSSYDEAIDDLTKQLLEIDTLLTEFGRSLSDYISDLEFDEEDFQEVEERLNLINHLKDKYGNSITDILEYASEKEKQLEILCNLEEERNRLTKELSKAREKALKLCENISEVRKKNASKLAKEMKKALLDLNFLDVKFEIQVRSFEDRITAEGFDEVEFMISTNPGESIRPLEEVASGGELSRIMLALKTVLADKDEIESLIFDEIDTGISGITAWKVSEKLGNLSGHHQILCITHLPQIAAMADHHYLIKKGVSESRTITNIKELNSQDSVEELGRLLGAGEITDAVRENAREMKKKASEVKTL